MSELEQRLRSALARRDPPDGFTSRVMAGTQRTRTERLGWVAAAVVAAMVAAGVWIDADLNRRARGERAKQEVMTALRVTGAAMNTVTDQLRDIRERRVPTGAN